MNPVPLILSLIAQHPDAVAGLLSFVVLGIVNGLLPTKVNGNIVTRVVSVLVDRLSPLTRKDARDTLKWPLFTASTLRGVADAIDPPAPPPSDPQRGAVRVGALLAICGAVLCATLAGALLTGCTPPPPSDGGTPVVTPSEWTRTARIATTVGRGLIPVAQVIVEATTTDPGRTQARRAFVAADAALTGLDRALDAYDARGGDRCAAHAAAGAAVVALTELAQVLADNGIALGVPLGRVVDLVGSVVDTLVPACNLDAGWASAGRAANTTLLGIERDARSRGVILRRDLDRITPALDGGVR